MQALVYIPAFAPDQGESVHSLIAAPPPGATVPPILPPQKGFLFLARAKFTESFAAEFTSEKISFMVDFQVPWRVNALTGAVTVPGHKSKPS